jgi:hypothetical protein
MIASTVAQTFNVTSQSSGYVAGAPQVQHLSLDSHAGYVQDTWRVLPRLTLSLGMRYEVWSPVKERDGLFLVPRLENGNIIQTVLDPNAVLDFAGNSANPFYKTDKNNFAPNFGIAWDPTGTGKTSIRAGYSIAYVYDNEITTINNNVKTSAGLSSNAQQTGLVATLQNVPNLPTPAYKVPRTLADNYALSPSAATGRPNPDLVTPYVQEWNFDIQHEFKNTIFEVRYVGNHATKLMRVVDYNQVLYNAGGLLGDFVKAQNNALLSQRAGTGYNPVYNAAIPGSQPLPVFGSLPSNGFLSNATVQSYLQQGQVGELANLYQTNGLNGSINFYPNPNILGANVVTNSGSSYYHALQIDIRRRTRAGLQYQFSYSFSKDLSNTAGDNQTNLEPLLDNANASLEKARSPLDITHSFKANFLYELPFGRGKKWQGGRVMNTVLGGWSVSGIWAYYSGSPYSVLSSLGTLNRAARSAATNTASIVPGVSGEQLNSLMNNVTVKSGNGTVYFLSPTILDAGGRGASTYGTLPTNNQIFFNPGPGAVGDLQRRMFTGPWQWSWDMSLRKTFRFAERHTVDIHGDFFNFMNHPTFYIPPASAGDYGSTTTYNVNNASFGRIQAMNYNPRVIQLGVRYRF